MGTKIGSYYKSKYTGEQIESAFDTFRNFAEEYSPTSTYDYGDFCLHDNKLYKCTTAITTAEPWTAAHWTQTYISELVESATGDMLKYQYDSQETVRNAGGIPSYSEKKGKVTIGGTEYTATRKPLVITNDGVTTTYYLCDIT